MLLRLILILLPFTIQANLATLENTLKNELHLTGYKSNCLPPFSPNHDVVIIGAGLSGLTVAAALFNEGITNIKLFDENPTGLEGPWVTYARMETLRSPKELSGPALDIPHLTYQAWHCAVFGQKNWDRMDKIPKEKWMDYLNWYREVMEIPVENKCRLLTITPMEEGFELKFLKHRQSLIIKARKVVLANGRAGLGGINIPDFVKNIPDAYFAHTYQICDYSRLKNKRVAVIGSGASSYDSATAALDSGAKQVDVLIRRNEFPGSHQFSQFSRWMYHQAFYYMENRWKWDLMRDFQLTGTPPLKRLVDYASTFKNYTLRRNTMILQAGMKGKQVELKTQNGIFLYDFLILATGVCIDCHKQPELAKIADQISLWKDWMAEELVREDPKLGQYPYLGPYFEFQERIPGTAPYLKDLHCFNYGSALSHGNLACEIPGISVGAARLAEGIAIDFFMRSKNHPDLPRSHQD